MAQLFGLEHHGLVCCYDGDLYCAALLLYRSHVPAASGLGQLAGCAGGQRDGLAEVFDAWRSFHTYFNSYKHNILSCFKHILSCLRNVLFWNLNYWDSACTLAGEVHEPRRVFPRALFVAMVLVIASYFLPLFVGVGMSTNNAKLDWRT